MRGFTVEFRLNCNESFTFFKWDFNHRLREDSSFQNNNVIVEQLESDDEFKVVPNLYLCYLAVLGTHFYFCKRISTPWVLADHSVFGFELKVAVTIKMDSLNRVVVVRLLWVQECVPGSSVAFGWNKDISSDKTKIWLCSGDFWRKLNLGKWACEERFNLNQNEISDLVVVRHLFFKRGYLLFEFVDKRFQMSADLVIKLAQQLDLVLLCLEHRP